MGCSITEWIEQDPLNSRTSLLHYFITPLHQFEIIDETDEYVVVNKPPFLLIHPTKPNGAPTLWKQLRELLAFEIASGGQVSIVNRLDRETSSGAGCKNGRGRTRFWAFDATTFIAQRISRDRMGLA